MRDTVLLLMLTALTALSPVQAEVRTETVRYQVGDDQFVGYLAWNDAVKGKRPGLLVAHEWWGLNDYIRRRTEMLAELGYVAFAPDVYGEGKTTDHPAQAQAWLEQITGNVDAWRERGLRALQLLRERPEVDSEHLAAIGYCFGGATVMQMAYAGADLDAVVSLHGSLPPPTPEQAKQIKARVLAYQGSQDQFVPPERVHQFQTLLDEAGVDWEMVIYGGVRHAFTNPEADRHGIENLRYDPQADRDSWEHLQLFLRDLFAQK